MTACMLAAIGCGCGSNSGSVTPPDDNTRISLSQSASTDTSVTVDVALENADAAYCTIAAAGSATPSLAEMRKGTSLTASGSVVFDDLAPGTSYKVFGLSLIHI